MGNSTEIHSDSSVTESEAEMLTIWLDDYCTPFLQNIAAINTASSSASHDNLSQPITSSLNTWRNLMKSEANAIRTTGQSLDSADSASAVEFQALLGMS